MADRIVDTDVLIDSLRGYRETHLALGRMIRDGKVATSVISVFELECGAETDEQRLAIRHLLEDVEVWVFDALDAVEAASIDRELRSAGQRPGTRDTLIAGVAKSRNLPLVTRNRRHFERVPGLRIEDPSQSP